MTRLMTNKGTTKFRQSLKTSGIFFITALRFKSCKFSSGINEASFAEIDKLTLDINDSADDVAKYIICLNHLGLRAGVAVRNYGALLKHLNKHQRFVNKRDKLCTLVGSSKYFEGTIYDFSVVRSKLKAYRSSLVKFELNKKTDKLVFDRRPVMLDIILPTRALRPLRSVREDH